jgi:hypothetical protein
MTGIAFTLTQSNGVVTTFVTILDLRWQPNLSADVLIGYFINENAFTTGLMPVHTAYVPLDITQIVTTGNIPAQVVSQLTAAGGICPGGTPVT